MSLPPAMSLAPHMWPRTAAQTSLAAELLAEVETYPFAVPMTTRFRGITTRQGLLLRHGDRWAEFSPFLDYQAPETASWLAAALTSLVEELPEPVRDQVPVNVTVPTLPPDQARERVRASGCRTAKVKVADRRDAQASADGVPALAADLGRAEAVRDALGPDGRLRLDANGAWTLDQAVVAIERLQRFDLEYVEQPCATVEELAALRRALAGRGIEVPIAADESIRRADDPQRVIALAAADVAVLKVQPLGGVQRCLELAEQLGLPVVVSSALETSVGLARGIQLAARLPELPFACGLDTGTLLRQDPVVDPLRSNAQGSQPGQIGVANADQVQVDPERLAECAMSADDAAVWQRRLAQASQALIGGR